MKVKIIKSSEEWVQARWKTQRKSETGGGKRDGRERECKEKIELRISLPGALRAQKKKVIDELRNWANKKKEVVKIDE